METALECSPRAPTPAPVDLEAEIEAALEALAQVEHEDGLPQVPYTAR